MKTFLISLFWLAIFAAIIAYIVVSEATGAPAPLPRRERAAYAPGQSEPAYWYGFWTCRHWPGWTLHFMPGGRYQAHHLDGSAYDGTWKIQGDIMAIDEYPAGKKELEFPYRTAFVEFSRP